MDSKKTITQIYSLLKQFGISKIVLTAGSRHLPLIHVIEQDPYFETFRMVDERSAAFFALGLIQKTGKPVALCCTSGTAVINLASGVIEAFYQKLPLLVISGDRMPEYLNQNEDQQYDQIKSFEGFTKYQVRLPRIDAPVDEWYTNRVINEAMLELTHHGNGPVHIDFPIENPFNEIFDMEDYKPVRKINLNNAEMTKEEWKAFASRLKGKRVGIVWGQSVLHTEKLEKAVNAFVEKFDAVIITDRISNCHYKHAITDTPNIFRATLNLEEKKTIMPEIVITVGGNTIFMPNIKQSLEKAGSTHWQVGKEDKVIDGFKTLTEIFEMSEAFFFQNMADAADYTNKVGYYDFWKNLSKEVPEPESNHFDELSVIKTVMKSMPETATLQIGNSWSIRMTQLIDIPASIKEFCNRGVNGIDGSMSTAVGYSALNENLTYLIIGDLSFFYDMNALWASSLSNKMRILLINNSGGSMLYKPFMKEMKEKYPMSNLGTDTKLVDAKGWAETTGFDYFAVSSMDELSICTRLMSNEQNGKPILVEAFTDFEDDVHSYDSNASIYERRSIGEQTASKAFGFAKRIFGK